MAFQGWSRRPTGLVLYGGGSTVRNLTAINGDTVVLYAIWKENGGGIVNPIEPPPDLEIMSLHADSASNDGSDYILTTYSYAYDQAGNRSSLTVVGAENYTTAYTYDANNRLLTEAKAENGETVTTTYTYDSNGNTLTKITPAHGNEEASNTAYSYNGFNQLTSLTIDGTTVAYAYNAQGIRTAKRVNHLRTAYLLDGGNVVAEVQNNTVTDTYLRGVNLIRRETNSETEYYLFNAHGDVVTTTNPNGTVSHSYDYDAFGNEKNPDILDSNPFRYCGEYLDAETGSYYLRARYYDPSIGRFTQEDTHWDTANMIYGDNPIKINEREDKLGLKTYSYAPQITTVMQSSNLYVYAVNNPVTYADISGKSIILSCILIFAAAGAIIGGFTGAGLSKSKLGYVDGMWVLTGAVTGGLVGGLIGWSVGAAVAATEAALTLGSGGTLGAVIYETWQQAEQSLRELVGSVSTYAERVFSTPWGNRVVDAYNKATDVIAEAKYGYVSLTQFIQAQIEKDAYLLQEGAVKSVEWHFYVSQVTGAGGPSAPLLEELLRRGFVVIFH